MRLAYFIIHCLETPPRMRVSIEDLRHWHMGPRDLENGKVKYLSKVYNSRDELPDDRIDDIPVRDKRMRGRGWDRMGYSVMFHRNGTHEIVTPYDDNDFVESDEISWGVAGYNAKSRHIALEGGLGAKRTDAFLTHFTEEQFLALKDYLLTELAKHPDVKVAGHNDFTLAKDCPGFLVRELLEYYGMETYGI